jgi:hypothetical protein
MKYWMSVNHLYSNNGVFLKKLKEVIWLDQTSLNLYYWQSILLKTLNSQPNIHILTCHETSALDLYFDRQITQPIWAGLNVWIDPQYKIWFGSIVQPGHKFDNVSVPTCIWPGHSRLRQLLTLQLQKGTNFDDYGKMYEYMKQYFDHLICTKVGSNNTFRGRVSMFTLLYSTRSVTSSIPVHSISVFSCMSWFDRYRLGAWIMILQITWWFSSKRIYLPLHIFLRHVLWADKVNTFLSCKNSEVLSPLSSLSIKFLKQCFFWELFHVIFFKAMTFHFHLP